METVNLEKAAATKWSIDALNRLIDVCKDGEKGYASAAADMREARARVLFERWAQERGQFAAALEELVASSAARCRMDRGSVAGALRRGWHDSKSALGR